jgi:Pyruvate/2-oxoacid:ferredoxin oxidoreductase delta subunit/flavodoxin
MKVSFLTFSSTGNTQHVANTIGKILTESDNQVQHIDILTVIKKLNLGQLSEPPIDYQSEEPIELTNLKVQISESDSIGLGTFANAFIPSPGVSELFEILPASLFQKMKYYFAYSTCGQKDGNTCNILATILGDKNNNAKFAGQITIITPENFIPLQPLKPYRDYWRESEIEKLKAWSKQLSDILSEKVNPPPANYAHVRPQKSAFQRFTKLVTGSAKCQKEKCVKCEACEINCPYNAITISSDIEDGFPVVNSSKCQGCGRCFNLCPSEAIYLSRCHSELRSQC